MTHRKLFTILSVAAAFTLVGGVSSAQSQSNTETRTFVYASLAVYPYNATCYQHRANVTMDDACQILGYQRSLSSPAPSTTCIRAGDTWILAYSGKCERTQGTAPN